MRLGDLLPGNLVQGDHRKALLFGAVGAVGCFLGALLGEIFLALLPNAAPPPTNVSLVMDCSSSMGSGRGSKLEEVKGAAAEFVSQQQLDTNRIGVVSFANSAYEAQPLSNNRDQIRTAIDRLAGGGGTNMTAGLQQAREQFQSLDQEDGRKYVLVFTDGQPNSESSALFEADECREQGITIVAIATADASRSYLVSLTGDPDLVIDAREGDFASSFQQAEELIYPDLIGREIGLFGVAGWTALITLGVSLALVIGQNWYLKRPYLNKTEALLAVGGGLLAGFVGGAIGQLLFLPFRWLDYLSVVGSLIGWTVLGALVGRGMAFFVPNLDRAKAPLGGAVGGAIASIGFLLAQGVGVESIGRLLGAIILGFVLGLLIALVEIAFREAWLEVRFGRNEVVKVSLGADPVRIGSDRRCTIFAKDVRPIVCEYRLDDGKVVRTDFAKERSETVSPGSQETIGNVAVTVHGGSRPQSSPSADSRRPPGTGGKPPSSGAASAPPAARPGPPPPPPPPPKRKP